MDLATRGLDRTCDYHRMSFLFALLLRAARGGEVEITGVQIDETVRRVCRKADWVVQELAAAHAVALQGEDEQQLDCLHAIHAIVEGNIATNTGCRIREVDGLGWARSWSSRVVM